jgi:hypothetical protein
VWPAGSGTHWSHARAIHGHGESAADQVKIYPRRRSRIYVSSQRPGLNECSKPSTPRAALRPPHIGNRFVSSFCLLSTSLASELTAQMSSSGRIRGDGPVRGRRTQCPDKASRGATCSPITTETIASSMAIMTRTRNARSECRVSLNLVTSSTHDSASAAERIAILLTSARSSRRSTRLAPNRRLANRIAFSHVLSSAHRLQVHLGRQRLDVPAIKHVEGSGNQGPPNDGNQSGEKQQCVRVARLIWSRSVSSRWNSTESE